MTKESKCSFADRVKCARCNNFVECRVCGMCTNIWCGHWLLCTLIKSTGVSTTASDTVFSFRASVSQIKHPHITTPNIILELSTKLFKTDFGSNNELVGAGSWILVVESPAPAIT